MDQLISKLRDYHNGKPSPNVKHTFEQNSKQAVALTSNPSVTGQKDQPEDLEIITPAQKDKAIAQQLSVDQIKADQSQSNRQISPEGSGYDRDESAVLAHLKLEG